MCNGDVGTMACPDCPDGYLWTVSGPTAKACPTCGGLAAVNLDGSRLEGARPAPEEYEPERRERLLEWDRGVGP